MDAPVTETNSPALQKLRSHWIPKRTELFRHIRPPEAETWLATPASASTEEAAWSVTELGGGRLPGVEVVTDPARLAQALATVPAALLDEYAPLAEAHAASCTGYARLHATAHDGEDRVIVRRRSDGMRDAPLLVVDVEPGARLVLVEDASGPAGEGATAMTRNTLTRIRVGAGARLRHLRIRREAPADAIATRTVVTVEENASYEAVTLAGGGSYHLERSEMDLTGPGATATSVAVLMARADQLEQQMEVRHAAPGTRSRVEALVLAADKARVVVNARTGMPRAVRGAIADQHLHGVPTAGNPRIVLRPHLEILHDEVEARHGATWGALAEDALFYASQRGIDPAEARALLVDGMASALIASCLDDEALLASSGLGAALAEAIAIQVGRTTNA